jgi:hypothetical protein
MLTAILSIVPVAAGWAAGADGNSKLVDVPFRYTLSGLPPWQLEVLTALRQASDALDEAYWMQLHPDAPRWYREAQGDRTIARLFEFGGPWDRLNDFRPLRPEFGAHPIGRNLYPPDLGRDEFEKYLRAHPSDRETLLSPYTVVVRNGSALVGVPYHEAFASPVKRAADGFRRAAKAARKHDEAFGAWLAGKAEALESDRYMQNDIAWVALEGPPIEVVAGPHEVYEDELWGVKAAYQFAAGLVDPEATARFRQYIALGPEIARQLPWKGAVADADRPVTAHLVAVRDYLRSGDALHAGYTFVATNLPNDPVIQEKHGTRKLFFMTAMEARVNAIVRPVAAKLLDPSQLPDVTSEAYLHGTALHELAHAFGPKSVLRDGRAMPVNEALRDRHSALEECKATVAGLSALPLLVDKEIITRELQRRIYVTELAGIFRDVRLGEAHADASTIELNWHLEQGAVTVDADGRWRAELDKWPASIRGLATALLEIQARGDYEAAGRFIERYGHFDDRIRAAVKRVESLPTEVFPVFEATG